MMEMFLDEKNIPYKDISHSSELSPKENIENINKVNSMIQFLIDMNNSKLMYELYLLMENQIITYNKYIEHRVLELTLEQYDLFIKNNLTMDRFTKKPFEVDSIVVCEYESIKYKCFGSKAEISDMLNKYNEYSCEDKGFFYLMSKLRGDFGRGLYVCNTLNDQSNYLFNTLIFEKLNILSRNSDGYIYYVEGEYTGLMSRCVFGELEGMYVLKECITSRPTEQKEELALYGEIEVDDIVMLPKEDKFELKLMESLSHLDVDVSFRKNNELEDAKG